MSSTFGIAPLILGLVIEFALEICLHFVTVDWDGPFALVLVCTAWRDMALRSNFLQSIRRDRRGGNPALKKNREEPGKGICIKTSLLLLNNIPSTLGTVPLIPGLVNEVALEIFLRFVAIDWDGPFTLVLVCTAWRDMVLGSNFLQSLRRNRRGRNPALRENREKAGKGICIVSFDGGGPGSLSQLRILDELMLRLTFKPGVKVDELRPADYFDLMGGVGFGGLVALLLGRLRMTTSQAMEELASIGTEIFPEGDGIVTREVNMVRLRYAIEGMLVRHGHPVDIQLLDSSENGCKVVLFAAPTLAMDHCHALRTYLAPRKCLECTFVDAACATMAIPKHFSSVAIGPRWRKQGFAGIPHGFDNPMREVLKESQLVFGETNPVSLVLSLGSGQRARPSDLDQHVTRSSSINCDGVARGLQYQFRGVAEYLRLNVDNGMENIELEDWSKLGWIETYTNVYLEMNPIAKYVDKACQWLRQRNGSVTLGQLTGTNADCIVKFHSESLENYLKMEFKQMHNVIQQLGIKWITLVDPIGNDIPIPISLCLNYSMLFEVISVYFRHQKVPGSDFVKRGDYRLVHGDRRNIMGQMEWTRIDKAGLKVEMSMILRTRDQKTARCPSCSTSFEGRDIDGWAQCLSCSTQFQVETQVQVEPEEDTTQSEEEPLMELVTSKVQKSESSQSRMRGATQLQFRLISVINITDVPFTSPPPVGTEGSDDSEQEEDDPTPSTSLTASTSTLTPSPTTVRWARFNVPDDVFLNPADPARHQLYDQIRQESWFLNQTQERSITGEEASRILGSLPGESVLLAFYDRVPDAQSKKMVMRCTICMQTIQNAHLYPRPDRARVHMRHHFELRPVPCNGQCNIRHCRQRFFTNSDLNAHVAGKTEPLVRCQYCAKPLRSKNLQRHYDHFCNRTPPWMCRKQPN